MIEIARNIFSQVHIEVNYELLNWSRSILMAQQGTITGIIGATPAEAPGLVYPTEPIGISKNSFWTRADSRWRYKGPRSLDQVQVGVIQDYDYGVDQLNAYLRTEADHHIQWVSSETALEQNIKKLAAGRVDVVIEDEAVFRYQAEKMNMADKFRFADTERSPDEENFIYVAFSPKEPRAEEYARILSLGIKKMRASGELQQILKKYELDDWQK